MANDARRPDLWASKLHRRHFDEADELIGIPRADLRPRKRLGIYGHELFSSIHAAIFAGRVDMSRFLEVVDGDRANPSSVRRRRESTQSIPTRCMASAAADSTSLSIPVPGWLADPTALACTAPAAPAGSDAANHAPIDPLIADPASRARRWSMLAADPHRHQRIAGDGASHGPLIVS